MMVIEGQRHALVTAVCDQRDRIVQPVTGRAVGVVRQTQAHDRSPICAT